MVAIEFTELDARTVARPGWRFDRVVLAGRGVPSGTLELHPHLNVVVLADDDAVGPTVERLRRLLHDGGPGEHVELTDAHGDAQVVFRPVGGRPRLIDIAAAAERSLDELAALSRIDDAVCTPLERALVARLCQLDQRVLWRAAEHLAACRAELASTAPGATGDGDVLALTAATRGAPIDLRPAPRRGFLRRRRAEPGMAPDLAVALTDAQEAWQRAIGDSDVELDVEEAMAQRLRIGIAAQLLDRLAALGAVSADPDERDAMAERSGRAGRTPQADGEPDAAGPTRSAGGSPGAARDVDAVVDAVCALVPLRRNAPGPHVVAVPGDTDRELASLLLDNLAGVGVERQLIVVTADGTVEDWARLESHARRAGLLHLGPSTD